VMSWSREVPSSTAEMGCVNCQCKQEKGAGKKERVKEKTHGKLW
jgi:hypothetical protein